MESINRIKELQSPWNVAMGNLPQKMSFFFLGLFYSYRQKKQLCKLDLKIQK
jgi:hypothetical protein